MNKKERYIIDTSRRLHVSENIVRLVVEGWESERKTPGGVDHSAVELVTEIGGGWFQLPSGEKIQGREKAIAAAKGNG